MYKVQREPVRTKPEEDDGDRWDGLGVANVA